MKISIIVASMLWVVQASLPSHAQPLVVLWENARANEPTLQASRASLAAASERTTQAIAALRPQLSASYSKNKNVRDYQQTQPKSDTQQQYDSATSAINLTQPIWRSANRHTWSQAEDNQRQALHQLASTEQELAAKFLSSWFDVMAARDTLRYTIAQINAAEQQLAIFQRGLALGSATIVQRDEASSKYEQALAEKLVAESDYQSKLAAVEQLAGSLAGISLPKLDLKSNQPLFTYLEPIEPWLIKADSQNFGILASMAAKAAAQREVQKQQAQHQPTLDFIASLTNNDQADAGNTPSQSGFRSKQSSFGIQLSIPLYAGGGHSAKVREASALLSKAEFELDATRRTAALQVKQAWAAARASLGKIAATKQAIAAAQTALKAAISGRASGLKTALDELQASQQLAAAQRDQLRVFYDNIVAYSKLRAATGEIDDVFMQTIQLALTAENIPEVNQPSPQKEMANTVASLFCTTNKTQGQLPLAVPLDCVKPDMSIFSFRIGLGVSNQKLE